MILPITSPRRRARMTVTLVCAKCQQPMPNWLGAIIQSTSCCRIVCRKCFGKSLTDMPDRPRVLVELNQQLLELIDTKADRLKSVACLAMQFSIQEADAQGIFSNPTEILKKALKTLNPRYPYYLLQTARELLIKRELWLPEGRQVGGRNNTRNKMRLGEKIRPFQAPR